MTFPTFYETINPRNIGISFNGQQVEPLIEYFVGLFNGNGIHAENDTPSPSLPAGRCESLRQDGHLRLKTPPFRRGRPCDRCREQRQFGG